jgi:hypothetical protein
MPSAALRTRLDIAAAEARLAAMGAASEDRCPACRTAVEWAPNGFGRLVCVEPSTGWAHACGRRTPEQTPNPQTAARAIGNGTATPAGTPPRNAQARPLETSAQVHDHTPLTTSTEPTR